MRNIKTWFGLIFAVALCFLDQSIALSSEQTAKLSITGDNLIFSGPGLFPPDETGHFAIGIRLPQPRIKASNCESPNLILGIGTLNKPPNEYTDADKQAIIRNTRYYQQLISMANTADKVIIPVRNKTQYIGKSHGVLSAPYCILSIDEETLP